MSRMKMDSRGKFKALARSGALLGVLFGLLGPACSSDKAPVPVTTCAIDKECSPPSVCAVAHCRTTCTSSGDCPNGGTCITDTNTRRAVCQAGPERNSACDKQADCPNPLACATDYRCRDLCATDADCNRFGVSGRLCSEDDNGVLFCADADEVQAGKLVAIPPDKHSTNAVEAPTDNPYRSAGVSGSGGAGNSAASAGEGGSDEPGGSPSSGGSESEGGSGGKLVTGRAGAGAASGSENETGGSVSTNAGSGGMSASSSGAGGASGAGTGGNQTVAGGGSGGGGGEGPPVCNPACAQGKMCVQGVCQPCGASGQACCDEQTCNALLSSNSHGTCTCGGANEVCCAGDACSPGLSCDTSTATHVCTCGGLGQRCCPDAQNQPATCGGSLACAGTKCGCVAEIYIGVTSAGNGNLPYLSRRTDGTLWKWVQTVGQMWTEQLYSAGGPLRLAPTPQSMVAGQLISCAIAADSSVWCFPNNGTLSDSTLLGAGLGSTDSTSGPVPVVTSLAGGALTNVKQLSASREPNADAFCALLGDGSIWCWGRGNWGQLGHGDTANSNYARPVLASAGTPLSGAAQVAMGTETTCARKTDGTVWCWGTNGQGELGVPKATLATSYYPVQVPLVGTTAQRTAKRFATGSYATHCAIMQDTTVQCWGYNGSGAAGAPTGATVTPMQVLMAANGAALSGVTDLTSVGGATMLAKTSNGLTAWGNINGATTPYPITVLDGSNLPITQVNLPLASGNNNTSPYWAYVDSAGRAFSNNGTTYSMWNPQPPCTGLLGP